MINQYKNLVGNYIKAKDNNKPHLMTEVFIKPAILKITVDTDSISFPSVVESEINITKTLVSDFNKTYENIYTICFDDTIELNENQLTCRWLVGMSEKENGSVRVGYGKYEWYFTNDNPPLVEHLTIFIAEMITLPNDLLFTVMSWFQKIPATWANSKTALQQVPENELLNSIRCKIA